MWKTYKYIYYWVYTWQKKLWGESDIPEYNTIIGMSLSVMANIFSLNLILQIFFDAQFTFFELSKQNILILAFTILILHYLLFVYKNKYKKIEKEFKKESKEDRKQKGLLVLIYIFGSLALFIFLMFFGIWFKS